MYMVTYFKLTLTLVLFLVTTPCFVTGWGVSNITWVRKQSIRRGTLIKRVKQYKRILQVLDIEILNRKECDKKLKKFKKNNMGMDNLCAGSKALNKSPCNVSGCSFITKT